MPDSTKYTSIQTYSWLPPQNVIRLLLDTTSTCTVKSHNYAFSGAEINLPTLLRSSLQTASSES